MNIDVAIQALLTRLRNIDRVIGEFENIAEGQIASRRPRSHNDLEAISRAVNSKGDPIQSRAPFEPDSVSPAAVTEPGVLLPR